MSRNDDKTPTDSSHVDVTILGAPSVESPSLEGPTGPRGPLSPKPDQDSPETASPTGVATNAQKIAVLQSSRFLVTAHGARLSDTDHFFKAGPRGPILLQDHHP